MNIATQVHLEASRPSGADWLGNLPSTWAVKKMKYLFRDHSQKGKQDAELLSVTQNQGVVPRSWVENRMVMPSGNLESFKFIEKGDFAISLRSFEGGLEYCHHDGIISPAYTVLKTWHPELKPGFYRHLFKSGVFISELQTSIVGIREGKNISFAELSHSLMPIPPVSEQRAIAAFLDEKCAKVDEAVRIKEEQIALLRERRQILIQQAVTRGLNPDAPMKDSGIDWIGQIPAHWEVVRFKYLFMQSRLPVRKDDGVVTSYRDGQVTLRANRRMDGYTEAILEGGYQGIRVGQLVLNSMDAFEGAIGVSDSDGKCTPEYVICDPVDDKINQYYFAYLLREMALADYIEVICNAVRQRAVRIRFNNLATRFMVLPPPAEQTEIVAFVEREKSRIADAVVIKQDQIAALREYKTSLINAAVTGKIKVA
ncbi:restriction endonuclease subunit S [Mesorhizobium sp. M5C.F.Ca.ET.164.01.1.1]|uniref:restriction endonuclease subunit S n=1 Tax=Mesorhizobium sp. M5C.F.Ca.ET.164.01.1.1 TaxID=2563957 RepID=UPI0010938C10|nr:restriction endonuclease subunit S [Mesorhizobium sp. M5C.F.Ca.ET.164.01.1.1]TGT99012.1 restriction endonuclease subunit S [Mesorhizobium sp. M5C.F.Ca.ET.164.01.1.1]